MSRQAGLLLLLSSVPLAWSDTDVSFQLIILPHRLYYAYHVIKELEFSCFVINFIKTSFTLKEGARHDTSE